MNVLLSHFGLLEAVRLTIESGVKEVEINLHEINDKLAEQLAKTFRKHKIELVFYFVTPQNVQVNKYLFICDPVWTFEHEQLVRKAIAKKDELFLKKLENKIKFRIDLDKDQIPFYMTHPQFHFLFKVDNLPLIQYLRNDVVHGKRSTQLEFVLSNKMLLHYFLSDAIEEDNPSFLEKIRSKEVDLTGLCVTRPVKSYTMIDLDLSIIGGDASLRIERPNVISKILSYPGFDLYDQLVFYIAPEKVSLYVNHNTFKKYIERVGPEHVISFCEERFNELAPHISDVDEIACACNTDYDYIAMDNDACLTILQRYKTYKIKFRRFRCKQCRVNITCDGGNTKERYFSDSDDPIFYITRIASEIVNNGKYKVAFV